MAERVAAVGFGVRSSVCRVLACSDSLSTANSRLTEGLGLDSSLEAYVFCIWGIADQSFYIASRYTALNPKP